LLNNKFKPNLKVLTALCHSEYSKYPPVAWRQAWRGLCCWSMALLIMLRSTLAHTSVRRCTKSFTSCTFCVVDSLLNYTPDFVVNSTE